MVNLPPDQNNRRDRDQILSFDELLAVVLALLGIGTIIWWSTSRDRNWLGNRFSLDQTVPSAITGAEDGDGGSDSSAGIFQPLVLDDDTNRGNGVSNGVMEAERRGGGLPSLVAPSGQSEFRTGPDDTAIPATEPEVLEPETLEPETLQPDTIAPEPRVEESEAVTAPPPLDISDVPADYWAYPFIKDLYDKGFLPDFPSGQFEPDKPLTRAELASLLDRAFVADPVERGPLDFADVPSGYWAGDAIDQVVERGFMSGYPNNEFQPDQLVPRYQVLVSLATGLDLPNPDNADQLLQSLGDLQGLPDWARPKIAASAQNSLIVNYPEPRQLNPQEPATRAEIVAMIHQALAREGKLDPIESEYVVSPQ